MKISYEKFLSIYVKAIIFYLPKLLSKVIHIEFEAQSNIFPGEDQFSEHILVKDKFWKAGETESSGIPSETYKQWLG